jgi:hypothetical protein
MPHHPSRGERDRASGSNQRSTPSPTSAGHGGCSSLGRAPALHAGGTGFESPQLHHGVSHRDSKRVPDQRIARASTGSLTGHSLVHAPHRPASHQRGLGGDPPTCYIDRLSTSNGSGSTTIRSQFEGGCCTFTTEETTRRVPAVDERGRCGDESQRLETWFTA